MIPLVNIDSKVESGQLAVDYTTDTLIIWGKENSHHTGCIFNIENNMKTFMIRDVPNDPMCIYTPHFMSKNELVVQNSENGSFDLYDLTSGQHVKNVNLPGKYLVVFRLLDRILNIGNLGIPIYLETCILFLLLDISYSDNSV